MAPSVIMTGPQQVGNRYRWHLRAIWVAGGVVITRMLATLVPLVQQQHDPLRAGHDAYINGCRRNIGIHQRVSHDITKDSVKRDKKKQKQRKREREKEKKDRKEERKDVSLLPVGEKRRRYWYKKKQT